MVGVNSIPNRKTINALLDNDNQLVEALENLDEAVGQYLILLYKLNSPKTIEPPVGVRRKREFVQFNKEHFEHAINSITDNIDIVISLINKKNYTKEKTNQSNENLIELALDIQDANERFLKLKPEFQEQLKELHSKVNNQIKVFDKKVSIYNKKAAFKLYQIREALTDYVIKLKIERDYYIRAMSIQERDKKTKEHLTEATGNKAIRDALKYMRERKKRLPQII